MEKLPNAEKQYNFTYCFGYLQVIRLYNVCILFWIFKNNILSYTFCFGYLKSI